MTDCKHEIFESKVDVARLVDNEGDDVVTGFSADILIRCAQCKLPFEFVGVPSGYSPRQPMVSFDKTELRAPIKPSSDLVEHAKVILTTEG